MASNPDVTDQEPLYRLSASAMTARLQAGTLRAEHIIDSLAESLPDLEDKFEAFIHLDLDAARAASRAVDRGERSGILAGATFAAKDNIDTWDMPTAYGTTIYEGARPARDASCVAAVRLAGAVLVGKTVSTEFAHRHPGKTRNPWNPGHTPGGSSSGSAAAVACGMVPFAFGTQTTGSVIRPAAYCGVVGYKPTYGDFNVSGVLANTPDFDTVGLMTRDVDDLVLLRRALLDGSIEPLSSVSLSGLRIGICRTPAWEQASSDAQRVLADAAKALEGSGAVLSDFVGDTVFDGLADANLMVSGYEFARTLAHERAEHYDRLSAVLRDGRMADGLTATYAEYVAGRKHLERLRIAMDVALEPFDLLITPPAPGAAPAGLAATGTAQFNMPWTTLHTPAVTLPVGASSDGLPVGIQLVARRYHDGPLLNQAKAVFAELGRGTSDWPPGAAV